MLIAQCVNVSFSYIRRNGNQLIHVLARRSLGIDEHLIWLEEAPLDVMDMVFGD